MIRALVAAAALAFAAFALPAAAQSPPPDPQALFAQERIAAGGAAWDRIAEIVERGTFSGSGLSGPYVAYSDPRTGLSKTEVMLAGSPQGSGYDARGAWSQQGSLVEPLEDAGSVASARTAAYVARNGWWHPLDDPATMLYAGSKQAGSKAFDVVHVVPKGGDAIDVWLDAASHTIAKIVQTSVFNNEVTTTSYAGYRAVEGVLYPFSTTVSNGDAKYDQHTVVDRVAFATVLTAADVTRPRNRRTGTIAGGTSTVIPFDLDDASKGHIVIVVRVNGSRPMHVIFDTGGSNVLTPQAARDAGILAAGAMAIGGAGEQSVSARLASGVTLALGRATMRDQQFGVFALPPSLVAIAPKYRLDGVVGYEILKNFVVAIDYVHRRLTLTDPQAFAYAGGGTAVHFASATVPVVPATFDGVPGAFMLDTGNAFYNTVSQTFVAAHQLDGRLPGSVLAATSGNIGGSIRPRLTRVATFEIGPYRIDRPVFAVTNTAKGALAGTAFAGNIGEPILTRFDVTLDYGRSVIYFKPNANFARPYAGTLDGMSLYRPNLSELRVAYVNPGSPAARAGIAAGDRIVAANGTPIDAVGTAGLAALESAKKPIRLTVVHDGTTATRILVPHEMVP